MQNKKDQVKEWNHHYKSENKLMFWPSEALIRSINFIKSKLSAHVKILDYGCGNGRNANFFILDKNIFKKKFNYYGFDISKNAINIAKLKTNSKKFRFDTKIYEQKYNLILCIAVLDQMVREQREKTLDKIYDLMNAKSYLILDVLMKNKFFKLQGLGKKIEKDTFILNNKYEKGIYQFFFKNKDIQNIEKKFKIIYNENYNIECFIYKKLKKHYSRKILILKKND